MSAIDPPEKKRRGCFFYGCITLLVFVFVMAVAGFFLARFMVNWANARIVEYTDTQPMTFPKVNMPAEELQKLQERVAAFSAAMDAHSNAPPLVLSSRDLNELIAGNTNFKGLKDMFYVEIEGDLVKGEVSVPVEKILRMPFIHTKGRYLNGIGTFKVGVTSQKLSVFVQSLEVKGKALPPQFMMQLQGEDMAAKFENNPSNAPVMGDLESIEVKDGKITVQARHP